MVAEKSKHMENVVQNLYAVRDGVLIKVWCRGLRIFNYFLECKLNGTIYDNGDKIVDPENPCEVCVCRGK